MLSVLPVDITNSMSHGRIWATSIAARLMIRFHSVAASLQRYGTLLELGEKRKDMLEKSCKKFMLFREANELQQWINEKESALTNEEVGSDLEQVEVLQKKFDDFQKVTLAIPGSSSLIIPLCPKVIL